MIQQISIDDYIDYVIKNFKVVQYPQIGKLYFFSYLFNQSKTFKADQSKFYDFYPATFIFNINTKEKTFNGLNIHMIPPSARKQWLKIIKGLTNEKPLNPKDFLKLKELLKIATFAVRNYSMINVRHLREVPREDWSVLLDDYANTTYQASMSEISAKYLSLI